jgi:hypothetical protein
MSPRARRTTAYSQCGTCGARVIWALTENGKRQMLDYHPPGKPDPAGNVAARNEASGGWRARFSQPGEALRFPEDRFMPHLATSPRCAPPKDADGQRAAAQDVVTYLHEYRKEHTS